MNKHNNEFEQNEPLQAHRFPRQSDAGDGADTQIPENAAMQQDGLGEEAQTNKTSPIPEGMSEEEQRQRLIEGDWALPRHSSTSKHGAKHAHSHHNKQKGSYKKLLWIIPLAIAGLVLLGFLTYVILTQIGKGSLLNPSFTISDDGTADGMEISDDGQTIIQNGKTYKYNSNMTNILFMGIDRNNLTQAATTYGTNGQADALFMLSIDTKTGMYTCIPIPRDTMVDVDLYSVGGAYIASEKTQLCLAYAYGDGKKTSCENTVKSVSRLFYGLPINSYLALDLQAMEVVTDKIGGVTVNSLDNLSLGDIRVNKGSEVKLNGSRAVHYLQDRDESNLNSSLTRMSRQKQFVQAMMSKVLDMTKKNITTPITLFTATSKYMVTDINVAEISFFTNCVLNNNPSGSMQFKSIDGTMRQGEKYAEYVADTNSIYNLILDTFYVPQQ